MTDNWEMCIVDTDVLIILSPGQPIQKMNHKQYALSQGKATKGANYYTTITYLLEYGWEPYAGTPSCIQNFFKRKLIS
jgi:hypothetical protein